MVKDIGPSDVTDVGGTLVSEGVADALENAKALREEGLDVVVTDIAGAGFEPATFGL
jgi:uncharacterized UPF0146 family protein